MKETLYCSKPSFPTLSKINNWGFWFKIMEKKDMCSSPPVESSKIATSSWTTTDRSTLEPTKKGYPHPKTKKKPQQDGRRGAVKIKSNPIPAGWVTHKLENNNTKEVLTLLWMFWIPHQGSWLGDQIKGLGIPRESGLEGQRDLTVGLPEDWGKQTPVLESTNKILHAPRPRGEEQRPYRRLNQNYLLLLEVLLWKHGLTGAHHRDGSIGRSLLA